jgi:uncharacterized membrane protein YgaE (UPF0421/DUF939 family)
LSLAIAQFLGLSTPIFAFIAAVIVTDLNPSESRRLGWRRIVATVVGALCGALLGQWMHPNPWTIGLSVGATMLICQLLQAQEGAKVAGFTCGIIMLLPGEDPWIDAFFRFAETVLGVGVAWSISYVPKLIRIAESESQSA